MNEHSKKLNDIWSEISSLQKKIQEIVEPEGFFKPDLHTQLQDISFHHLSPDERQKLDELCKMEGYLRNILRSLERLNAPVACEGRLHKRSDGRYGLENGNHFTSGSAIEVLVDDEDEGPYWLTTRVEHNGDDYYIVDRPNWSMEGLYVRSRG